MTFTGAELNLFRATGWWGGPANWRRSDCVEGEGLHVPSCPQGGSILWDFHDDAGCCWGIRCSCREEQDGCMNSGLRDLRVSIISRVSSLLCQQLEQGTSLSFCFKDRSSNTCSYKLEFLLLCVSFLYFLSWLQPVLSYNFWHGKHWPLSYCSHSSLSGTSKDKVSEGENGK